jgi:hypothetical protein
MLQKENCSILVGEKEEKREPIMTAQRPLVGLLYLGDGQTGDTFDATLLFTNERGNGPAPSTRKLFIWNCPCFVEGEDSSQGSAGRNRLSQNPPDSHRCRSTSKSRAKALEGADFPVRSL